MVETNVPQAAVAAEGSARPRESGASDGSGFMALLLQLAAGAGDAGLDAAAPVADGEGELAAAENAGALVIEPGSLLVLMFQDAASSASATGSPVLAEGMLSVGLPWELIGSGELPGALAGADSSDAPAAVAGFDGAYAAPQGAEAPQLAAEPGAPSAAPEPSRVLVQVFYAAAEGARRSVETVRLRLQPPNLGRVEVVLSTHEGRLSASFRVENDQVRQMLEANLDALKEGLAQAGFAGAGVDVSNFDRRYETMPVGGRKFAGKWIRLEGPDSEAQSQMTARLAWPWSVIDTVA